MRKYCTIIGLLLVVVLPVCAQNWTPQDSLRLRRLLDGEGEIKLNPEVLKEMGVHFPKYQIHRRRKLFLPCARILQLRSTIGTRCIRRRLK